MSLKPYPTYKDSGVAWLGNVPEQWRILPFYSVAYERDESNKGMIEDNLLSLSYGRIIRKDMESNDGLLPESFETYQVVRSGDIIFRLTDLQNDKRSLRTAIVSETGIITSAYLAAKPFGITPEYFNYLLRSYDVTKVFYSMGGGLRQSMKFDDIKRLPILVPAPAEQSAIATFLDRETGKIDELIAEQEKLIALLAEKRQATISHAVTKGLNPAAAMKDSGVEWLGQIPAHWKMAALSYIASIETGATPDRGNPNFWNGTIPWIKTGEVNWDSIYESEEYVTEAAMNGSAIKLARPSTLIMAMYGQGVTRGRCAILAIDATFNQACAAISFGVRINVDYGRYFFMAAYDFIRNTGNETSQMNLSAGVIAKFKMLIPPLNEQTAICAALHFELAKCDDLNAEANRVIDLLKERRTALISAAVTGKVDVRRPLAQIVDLAVVRRRVRGLLAIELIEKSQGRNTFGRTALQKQAYLAEVFVGVHEMAGNYVRNAYGPLDSEMIDDMESEAQALCGIVTQPPSGMNRSVTYLLSQQAGSLSHELAQNLGPERISKLQRLHTLMAPLNTHEAEGVATLFAVWNDFLIQEKDPNDDEIVNGFLNDWHPKKIENFNAQELHLRLDWMRRNGLVPTGAGPKTATGRLFV